jgi:hypothetical protein
LGVESRLIHSLCLVSTQAMGSACRRKKAETALRDRTVAAQLSTLGKSLAFPAALIESEREIFKC